MAIFRYRQPDPRIAELSTQVAALQARLSILAAPLETPPLPTPAPPTPPLPPPSIDYLTAPLRNALDELAVRLDRAEQSNAADRERVDARLSELGSTLTDQLHELSGELESGRRTLDERLAAASQTQDERLAAFKAELEALAAGHDDGRVDDLLERQTRIANEVARHEIAFQQELAALADRLTRQRPNR